MDEHAATFILKSVARACKEFDLLAAGDRIAVAVSGGKDSRTLLDMLIRYRRRVPFSYELVAIHIVGTSAGLPDMRPVLEPWFCSLDVAYHFAPLELPPNEPLPLDCFRCSWNRRKALFTAAVAQRCNKLAFGHHADDAAATTLLNVMFNGRMETMAPCVDFFSGTVTVIRPLIYVPEKEIAYYARQAGFPEGGACPQGAVSRRAQVKDWLRGFGRSQAQIRANLWRTARQEMGF